MTKLTFKQRLLAWYVARRIRREFKMQPMPKWMSWIGNLGALAGLVGGLQGVLPPKYAILCSTLAAWLNSVSHSVNGTGGKPQ